MEAESVAPPIDRAWGQIPARRIQAAERGRFTRRRIDRIAAVAAGVGCLALGAQAFVLALGSPAGIDSQFVWPLYVIVFGALLLMCVACMFERSAKIATGAFAIVYTGVLLAWPLLSSGAAPVGPEPWPWYLVNVSTMAAVIAFPTGVAVVWTIVTPLLYGLMRLIDGGFAPEYWGALVLEVPYSLILGSLLLVLATIFRRMASGVDAEREAAVSSYAKAAAAQAAQEERVAVSALMHDSVLAALIAAERADSPRARSLAVSMAREALEGLAETGTPAGGAQSEPMSLRGLGRSIQASLADLGVRQSVEVAHAPDAARIPGEVATAMVRAATQAVANAVQHADAVGLAASVGLPEGTAPGAPAVQVVVSDRGPGFDVKAVPDDRLGISASIIARVSAVGGSADIASGPGGTVVTLTWREA